MEVKKIKAHIYDMGEKKWWTETEELYVHKNQLLRITQGGDLGVLGEHLVAFDAADGNVRQHLQGIELRWCPLAWIFFEDGPLSASVFMTVADGSTKDLGFFCCATQTQGLYRLKVVKDAHYSIPFSSAFKALLARENILREESKRTHELLAASDRSRTADEASLQALLDYARRVQQRAEGVPE